MSKDIKIPNAEKFLRNSHATGMAFNRKAISEVMIEFAKLHVKATLEVAANNLKLYENMRSDTPQIMKNPFDTNCDFYVDKDSILSAYPEELIK